MCSDPLHIGPRQISRLPLIHLGLGGNCLTTSLLLTNKANEFTMPLRHQVRLLTGSSELLIRVLLICSFVTEWQNKKPTLFLNSATLNGSLKRLELLNGKPTAFYAHNAQHNQVTPPHLSSTRNTDSSIVELMRQRSIDWESKAATQRVSSTLLKRSLKKAAMSKTKLLPFFSSASKAHSAMYDS